MTYCLSPDELIRFENYGEMFRDALISLTGINPAFAKFHQSEVFPEKAIFESEQVFKESRTKYQALIKRLDAMALKISRELLFGGSEEKQEDVTKELNILLIDIYRQRKWAKKIKNQSLEPRERQLIPTYCGTPFFALPVYKYIDVVDRDIVIDGIAMWDAFTAMTRMPIGKKKLYRWVKQNINRFKISKDRFTLKYVSPSRSNL